ncbi:hypothetical protein MaudCBS49596_007126 [Microsporum audouinii]
MPKRIIIDTDPGVDDILALLLAFSSSAEELQVLLVSLTFGNIEIRKEVENHKVYVNKCPANEGRTSRCLRNAVSVFHVVEKELAWRRERGLAPGFEALRACKPIVACGADRALDSEPVDAGYFHGFDGLGNVHTKCPHLSAEESYEALFAPGSADGTAASVRELEAAGEKGGDRLYTPSRELAHREMLRLLRENDAGTITVVAVGPLTNLALAAAEDLDAFLRAKEVVIMGGAIDEPGNVRNAVCGVQRVCRPRGGGTGACADVEPAATELGGLADAAVPARPPGPAADAEDGAAGPDARAQLHALCVPRGDTATAIRWVAGGGAGVDGGGAHVRHDPGAASGAAGEGGGGGGGGDEPARPGVRVWTRGMTVVDRRVRAEIDTVEAEEVREDDRGWWRVGVNRVGVLEEGPGLLSEDLLARLEK